MFRIAFLIASLALSGPAVAQEAARVAAFHEGRFLDAANRSEPAPETADDAAFAARSILAECMTGKGTPDPALVAYADALARRALALEPEHAEGRLQLAIALSLQLRDMSNGTARRSGLGAQVRTLATSVIADDPGNAYAHGLMAVWHIEVRRRGGVLGASFLGASIETAREHYEAATDALPGDASIHWQYARALAALDAGRYRGEIDAALMAARASTSDTALERIMAGRALELAHALASQPESDVERLAQAML